MRILFTAMADSVHVVRWIEQVRGTGWDLHLFPAEWPCDLHPDLDGVTLHGVGLWRPPGLRPGMRVAGLWPLRQGGYRVEQALRRHVPGWPDRARQLARVIRRLRPDLVHSIEMQRAGYLTLAARQAFGAGFPPWLYSCWGNDIYYFGRQPDHVERVRAVLAGCDFFTADCHRDARLAREFGFTGTDCGYFPGPGGFDLDGMQRLRQAGPVAARRTIAVKGYDNWAGRARLALAALQRCAEVLRAYEIVVYSAPDPVVAVVDHIARVTGLRISVLPRSGHAALVRLMGRARVAVGINVTDGTPNSMLEAMAMGALPVQSDTVSTAEWITDGVNGLLVPPEDVAAVEQAIRRAVEDDELVERAALHNARLTRDRIDRAVVQPRVLAMYEGVGSRFKVPG